MSAAGERGVQKLELTEKRMVQLRAGSEINLTSTGKHNKRTSFRQSLAVCTERAQVGTAPSTRQVFLFTSVDFMLFLRASPPVQAGFLNPLLRRTASAKTSLRRAPSALFFEPGKVFQRRKVSHASVSSPDMCLVQGSPGPANVCWDHHFSVTESKSSIFDRSNDVSRFLLNDGAKRAEHDVHQSSS